MHKRVLFWLVALVAVFQTQLASASTDKLSSLSQSQLGSLVSELDTFYKQSIDALFSVNADEEEKQLGLRVSQQLLKNYDSRAAGRCTKIMTSQALNQYISVVYGRLAKSQEAATKLATDYAEALKKYELAPPDMKQTGDCSVFEYDFEPMYESPITVYHRTGWWIFGSDEQIKTHIRLVFKNQKADGSAEVEAVVGAGYPQGRYSGIAKRDLHDTKIQISLMRDNEPLLIEGELTMTGNAYREPVFEEPAPKMQARVLSGFLTVNDSGKRKLNNAVLLVARESDATIGKALGGFQVPSDASYGSYLNVLLVTFRGKDISRDVAKFAAFVDEAYNKVQKDNPIQSFHPTRKPLFMTDNEISFLVVDIASDVNALAASILRSSELVEKARALGAQLIVVPFYKVQDGKLRVQFPGRPASEMKFNGFEGLSKSIFTMYAALTRQQQEFFEKFGIKKISDDIKAMQAEVVSSYKAMGPILDALLAGREVNPELDKELTAKMDELLKKGQGIVQTLSTILDTRDTKKLLADHAEFLRLEGEILAPILAAVPAEKADLAKTLEQKVGDASQASLKKGEALASAISEKSKAIDATLNYLNTFTVRVELDGKYVASNGKLVSWTWKWERTLSGELESFFTGEKYVPGKAQKGRRGD